MNKFDNSVLVMFSGGLDSVMAAHLLKSQGLCVTALHFVLPFNSGIGWRPRMVEEYARALDIPLRVEEEGAEFLEMVRSPRFGYGKNANPCVDCRIHRLKKAAKIMDDMGAVCLATGEVVGQRPMSQKLETMNRIIKLAGLEGKLLRPLSAKLLDPTEPELAGIIDREKLLDISGRSRAAQLAYAKQHGLSHSAPAGGCILTNVETGARFSDLKARDPDFTLADFKLLAYGRHFRPSPTYRVIVARNSDENEVIEKILSLSIRWDDHKSRGDTVCMNDHKSCGDRVCMDDTCRRGELCSPDAVPHKNMFVMYLRDTTGPLAVGIGKPTEEDLRFSASAVVRFSRLRGETNAAVIVKRAGVEDRVIETGAASEDLLDKYRVSSTKH